MLTTKRLIEVAFPLEQTSLDAAHEKYVRHGHLSTLHIWPARRPLAACRAALIATLLPDPGDDAERQALLARLGGHVNPETGKTVGGILHWKREASADLAWFREAIAEHYDGPPRVLDPFAGGGAIPLEAMRLGCEAAAVDINPVAWFLLKCTLEYPQRLAGKTHPLPDFALQDRDFMADFFAKARGLTDAQVRERLDRLGLDDTGATRLLPGMASEIEIEADLEWHVRAWGRWVLEQARASLRPYYPTVDGRPTVAYLWARTVTCKHCRATIPLLKTRWLVRKGKKRVRLTMAPNAEETGVIFGIDDDPPKGRKAGEGTMSRSGATCPVCDAIMTMADLRVEGRAGNLDAVMTAVVVEGESGKAYRLPTDEERRMAEAAERSVQALFETLPFGLPEEPLPDTDALGARVPLYGFKTWGSLFTPRQLLVLGTLVDRTRTVSEAMLEADYSKDWEEAVRAYLALVIDRTAERGSTVCHYDVSRDSIAGTFQRYALPISWDFAESVPINWSTGSFEGQLDWVARYVEHALDATEVAPPPNVINKSAIELDLEGLDVVLTDPPYYDAIPYSDTMDFFYVWLRRTLSGLSPEIDAVFDKPLAPKWDHEAEDGELIDDASRFEGDADRSKAAYETGMRRAFEAAHGALKPDGRLVVVFANKQPDAWETLVSALIRAGYVVTASWPIQTEMTSRTRAMSSAALASSVWLVCRKRPRAARPGWDTRVLEAMQARIKDRLAAFWEAGIRGPDFVWAATGPAMEAYSRHPVVKKADQPGEVLTVGEFLRHVRRMVVDFVVGRVLSGNGDAEEVSGLDDATTYYLLHRHDFGMEPADAGAVILYALSCNLSDDDLVDRRDLLDKRGSKLRLRSWTERADVGYDPVLDAAEALGAESPRLPGFEAPRPSVAALPLIDQVHRLLHLWRAGDVTKVNAYLSARGLRRSPLFHQLLQALIELAPAGSEERSLLESLSNHVGEGGREPARLF
jgi:adenine-specific DNA methylase